MKYVIKRDGHTETYDPTKTHASIYATLLATGEPHTQAQLITHRVVSSIDAWISNKHEVTTHDIRAEITRHLSIIRPQAGHVYAYHRILN